MASAVHLRYDLHAARLPSDVRDRLLALGDSRITEAGVVVIKAQSHRRQEQNRVEAIERLVELVRRAARPPRKRIPTNPTRASQRRRVEAKKRRGDIKRLRRKDW